MGRPLFSERGESMKEYELKKIESIKRTIEEKEIEKTKLARDIVYLNELLQILQGQVVDNGYQE